MDLRSLDKLPGLHKAQGFAKRRISPGLGPAGAQHARRLIPEAWPKSALLILVEPQHISPAEKGHIRCFDHLPNASPNLSPGSAAQKDIHRQAGIAVMVGGRRLGSRSWMQV
jgi:hypothetical protein